MFDEVMNTSLHWTNETSSINNFNFTNTTDFYLATLPKILRHFFLSYISLEAIFKNSLFQNIYYFFVLVSVQKRIQKLLTRVVNTWKPLTIFARSFMLSVWLGSGCYLIRCRRIRKILIRNILNLKNNYKILENRRSISPMLEEYNLYYKILYFSNKFIWKHKSRP